MFENQNPEPSPVAPDGMGILTRFWGIYTSPGRVFQSLATKPVWMGTVLLVACFVALLNLAFLSTERGHSILRETIEEGIRGSNLTLSEEQIDTQILVGWIAGPVSILIFLPVICLILTGIVYFVFNILMGGDSTFRHVLAACTHILPISILHSLVSTFLIFSKGSFQATTSLAAFTPFLEQESLGYRILQGLDFFYLWQLGVLSLGLSILYRFTPKRCATALYGIYLVLVVGIALIRQMFS